VFGKNFCNTCRRRIQACPQCGKRMIAAENPFCDNCGYDGTRTTGTSEVTVAVAASSGTG
jgi:predicted amidophosphoribosyltransferase